MRVLCGRLIRPLALFVVPAASLIFLYALHLRVGLIMSPTSQSKSRYIIEIKLGERYMNASSVHSVVAKRLRTTNNIRRSMPATKSNLKVNIKAEPSEIGSFKSTTTKTLDLFHVVDFKAPISKKQDKFRCVLTSTEPDFTVCVYRSHQDIYISKDLITSGLWEPHITQLAQKAFSNYRKATFIDIGANIGYFSLLAASSGHSVVAVEPADEHVNRFRKAVYIDRIWDKITLLKNAVSDGHTFVEMTQSQNNQGNLYAEETRKNTTGRDTVKTITLNDLRSFVKTKTGILKIDIEGYECRAFRKSKNLFNHVYIPYILMEWMFSHHFGVDKSRCNKKEVNAMKFYLVALGYHPFNADLQDLTPINPEFDINDQRRKTDIIWVHRDARPLE